jgi:esterase/lipase superfamily enzyme
VGGQADVLAYGHWGRPVLVVPAEQGRAWDFEANGMLEAVRGLLDEGRVKIYCVDGYDGASWSDRSMSLEERVRRYAGYEAWILDQVAPWIHGDCGGPIDIVCLGCSLGALHAVNISFKRADLFPVAIGLSGRYDPATWRVEGGRAEPPHFNNPMDYVPHLHGDHLAWVRARLLLLLVVGTGQWEDTTGSLAATTRLAELLSQKGIRYELDVWGADSPHDWQAWRRQVAKHLPRFC